jgi:ABC-2 type transport system permease protein
VSAAGVPATAPEGEALRPGGATWASDLRKVASQVRYEQLAFWRNRVGAIFTVGFSVIFVVLLGATAGSSRITYLDGVRLVQYYTVGFVAYGVMAACFSTLCISLVVRRETGLLKRLRLSPLPAWALLAAIFVSTAVVAAAEVVLTLAIARGAFAVEMPRHVGAFVLVLLVGVVSFTALGVAMSTLVSNQEAAGPVTNVVFFVLLFLSGLWYPFKPGSALAQFSSWFPLRRFIEAVYASFGVQRGVSPWAWSDLLVMAVWGLAGVVVAVRRFRWAPWRA